MSEWIVYGTFATIAVSVISVLMFFVTNRSSKILGRGLVRDLLMWLLVADIFYLLFIGIDVVSNVYEIPLSFAFKILFQLLVPLTLLYAMWLIKKYADKLKEMAD